MMTFESKRSRRLIVRLDPGEELVGSLEGLARREGIAAAWVRGFGSLAWVELDRHDQLRQRAEPPQRFDVPSELLTLEGNVAMSEGSPRALLHATLARRTDNGVDVIGGRVRAAGVFACELVLECFADLTLSRAPEASTGLARLGGGAEVQVASASWVREREHEPPAGARRAAAPDRSGAGHEPREREHEAPEPPRASGVSWADVAAVSAAPPVHEPAPERPSAGRARPAAPRRRAEALDEVVPERGDFLDHRQFGLCKIDREDDEGGLVIRLPSGVRKTIKLDFMEVGQPRMEGTRRVFPIRPRKR